MPQLNRMYCSRCKRSIYNVLIDGVRVPLILYFVVGQPGDTGPTLNVCADGVKVPSFVREIMAEHVPTARAELCMECVAHVFGVQLLTAKDDPMYSVEQTKATKESVQRVQQDETVAEVDRNAATLERALLAVEVGRGATAAPPLPKPAVVSSAPKP